LIFATPAIPMVERLQKSKIISIALNNPLHFVVVFTFIFNRDLSIMEAIRI
jgi:hypothetical protein